MFAQRKLLVPMLALSCLVLLSGCWSAVELNNNAFARIMLLDKAKEGIELTLEFALPNRMVPGQAGGGGGQSGPPFSYVTKRDGDVAKAYRDIQSDMSRTVTFGQLRVVVMSSKLAEDGVEAILDFFTRESKTHINANIYVTEGPTAQLTTIPVRFERFPTDILASYAEEQVTVSVTFKDLLMSNFAGGDLLVPLLVFGRQGTDKENDSKEWMGTGGAAIFKAGKMVGKLNTEETRGALWILGQVKDSEVNVASPTDGRTVNFLVTHEATRIETEFGGRPTFHIRCKANAEVLASDSDIDLEDPEQLSKLEKKLAAALEERMGRAIDKTRLVRSDAFQLGSYVRWRNYREWNRIKENWREIYATAANITEDADITISRLGSARKSIVRERVKLSGGEIE